MRALPFALLLSAACGSPSPAPRDAGPDSGCGDPGSVGSVTVSDSASGAAATLTCFSAARGAGFLTGQTADGGVALLVGFDTSCSVQAGQAFQLTDPCVSVILDSFQPDGGIVPVFGSVQNAPCLKSLCQGSVAPLPDTQGSLTVTQWSTTAGATVGLSFSSDAQLTGVTEDASGNPSYAPFPIHGAFSTTLLSN
ncbi:MAG: hypothetical protein ACYCWW_06125 [Deltaproteobacteria bacterium]